MTVYVRFNRIDDPDNPMKGPVVATSVQVHSSFVGVYDSEKVKILKEAIAKEHPHLYSADEINILDYKI